MWLFVAVVAVVPVVIVIIAPAVVVAATAVAVAVCGRVVVIEVEIIMHDTSLGTWLECQYKINRDKSNVTLLTKKLLVSRFDYTSNVLRLTKLDTGQRPFIHVHTFKTYVQEYTYDRNIYLPYVSCTSAIRYNAVL